MAPASTLSARPQGVPARQAVQRAVRTYSFGFAAVLAIGMLVANIATVHGGFGVAVQLANVAPMAIAALASAPSIIAGGFDISISPLIVLTNAVYIVWLAPNGLGGAVSVPIILGLGLAVGVLNGLLIIVLRVQAIVVTLASFIVAGALTVTALRSAYHLSFGVALLLAIVGSGLLGGAAGYICHRFAINPLVVTPSAASGF